MKTPSIRKQMQAIDPYYLRPNSAEECWEIMERDDRDDDGTAEDALIARFYDGNSMGSALAIALCEALNQSAAVEKSQDARGGNRGR